MLPDCEALMVQVPAVTSVTVVPLTVHTEGVTETNCTAKPEPAVAARAGGVTISVCAGGAVKLMLCAPTTKKDCDCAGAAA